MDVLTRTRKWRLQVMKDPLLRKVKRRLKVLSNNASMACFPSRFARKEMNKLRVKQRLTCGGKSKIHLWLPTLKSTISFLSARTSAKWRSENMTFKWLACTSQESVKIPTREERNRPWEGEIAREREKNVLKKKVKHERERAHKSISHRSTYSSYSASWENLMMR